MAFDGKPSIEAYVLAARDLYFPQDTKVIVHEDNDYAEVYSNKLDSKSVAISLKLANKAQEKLEAKNQFGMSRLSNEDLYYIGMSEHLEHSGHSELESSLANELGYLRCVVLEMLIEAGKIDEPVYLALKQKDEPTNIWSSIAESM